jgi:hypothetical protein
LNLENKDFTGCKYYKGEKESPYKAQNKNMLWAYESAWLNGDKKYDLGEYEAYGLKDFMKDDGVPETLKALLFNRYSKCCYSLADGVPSFKKFYHKYYN